MLNFIICLELMIAIIIMLIIGIYYANKSTRDTQESIKKINENINRINEV